MCAGAGPFVSFLSDVLPHSQLQRSVPQHTVILLLYHDTTLSNDLERPIKEAQRAFARADWEIRDGARALRTTIAGDGAKHGVAGVNRVTEVVTSPVKPPEARTLSLGTWRGLHALDGEVLDATGAEAAVMAAGLSLGLLKNIQSQAKADNRQPRRYTSLLKAAMPTAFSFCELLLWRWAYRTSITCNPSSICV